MKIKRLAGPDTHICWTPDNIPKEQRKIISLVEEEDLVEIERRLAYYENKEKQKT